jgi:hypothetical protein
LKYTALRKFHFPLVVSSLSTLWQPSYLLKVLKLYLKYIVKHKIFFHQKLKKHSIFTQDVRNVSFDNEPWLLEFVKGN